MVKSLMCLLLATSVTSVTCADDVRFVEDLSEAIIEEGYSRIGILPRPIYQQGSKGKPTLGRGLGPQAEILVKRLAEDLLDLGDCTYEIVDADEMLAACRRYSLSQINKKSVRKQIAKRVKMDALVIPVVTEVVEPRRPRQFELKCQLIGLSSDGEDLFQREIVKPGLMDAAYMGESWELRRWSRDGNKMQIVGFTNDGTIPEKELFGTGPKLEQRQYGWIDRKRMHPLDQGSGFPFGFNVVVGQKPVRLTEIQGAYHAILNTGDEPTIKISNRSSQDVYVALFIDGINVFGKRREHPGAAIPKTRHRLINQRDTFEYRGWYTPKGGNTFTLEPFKIVRDEESVAAGQGFTDQLGMITAVFYSVGWQGVPVGDRARLDSGRLGFGAGRPRPVKLDASNATDPGILLAAVTIYYASSKELAALAQ